MIKIRTSIDEGVEGGENGGKKPSRLLYERSRKGVSLVNYISTRTAVSVITITRSVA